MPGQLGGRDSAPVDLVARQRRLVEFFEAHGLRGWFEVLSTLLDDRAPPARRVPPRAQAALKSRRRPSPPPGLHDDARFSRNVVATLTGQPEPEPAPPPEPSPPEPPPPPLRQPSGQERKPLVARQPSGLCSPPKQVAEAPAEAAAATDAKAARPLVPLPTNGAGGGAGALLPKRVYSNDLGLLSQAYGK